MTKGSILISDCAFWRKGCGEPARQREILQYLAELGPVDLIYFGSSLGEYEQLTSRLMGGLSLPSVRCQMLRPDTRSGQNQTALLDIVERVLPKRVVVMTTALSWVPLCMPADVATFIDGETANVAACLNIPQIVNEIDRFETILCAYPHDLDAAQSVLGEERCQLAPTPISLQSQNCQFLPKNVVLPRRIGLYLGPGRVGYEAVAQFKSYFWDRPEVQEKNDSLQVVVGLEQRDEILCSEYPKFEFVEVSQPDSFFNRLSCLHIPNVGDVPQTLVLEALGYMCPIVTAPEVLTGLPEALQALCVVCDKDADIARELLQLAETPEKQSGLMQNIQAAAEGAMSRRECLAPLGQQHDAKDLEAPSGLMPDPLSHFASPFGVRCEEDDIPRVCICLAKFEKHHDDWLPLTQMPGVRVCLRDYEPNMSMSCDLVITDDLDCAEKIAQTPREVWLCDLPTVKPKDQRIRLFPCPKSLRWHVGEIAAHLAVWLRKQN